MNLTKLLKSVFSKQEKTAPANPTNFVPLDAYNLYQATQKTQYHLPQQDFQNINESIADDGENIMRQARYLEANNAYFNAILNRYEALMVGESGITVEPAPKMKGKDGKVVVDTELADLIQHEWREFCTQPLINDRIDYIGFLRMLVRCWLRDGEVFVRTIYKRSGHKKYDFKVKILTADQLEYGTPLDSNNAPIILGEYGEIVSYNFKKENSVGEVLAYERIPADEIFTVANKREPNQLRGISVFAAAILPLKQLDSYQELELIGARLSAQMLGDISSNNAIPNPAESTDNVGVQNVKSYISIIKVPEGKKLTMHNPNKTNTDLGNFVDTNLRRICSCVGIDFEGVALKCEKSYSAARLSLNNTEKIIKLRASMLIGSIIRPLYRAFVQYLLDHGKLGNINEADYISIASANYHLENIPSIDPLKEVTANQLAILTGQDSLQGICKKQGRNYKEVANEMLQSQEYYEEIGLGDFYKMMFNVNGEKPVSEDNPAEDDNKKSSSSEEEQLANDEDVDDEDALKDPKVKQLINHTLINKKGRK